MVMQAITVITYWLKREKNVFPQAQGVAENSKSKQTHVGFSMSILVQSQDECMQIKADLLQVFPIEM